MYFFVVFDCLYLCVMIVNKILWIVLNLLFFGDKKCGIKWIWYFLNSEINLFDCIISEIFFYLYKWSFYFFVYFLSGNEFIILNCYNIVYVECYCF